MSDEIVIEPGSVWALRADHEGIGKPNVLIAPGDPVEVEDVFPLNTAGVGDNGTDPTVIVTWGEGGRTGFPVPQFLDDFEEVD